MSIPRYLNIEGNDTLVRDTFSMGIINTNKHAFEAAKRAHTLAESKLAEERRKDQELNNLRQEIAELKRLVLFQISQTNKENG